jgi:MinD superfamily P-loop ATPase
VGCPVIATLGGVDLCVVVTEPTVSGRHDLERVVQTARFFKVPVAVVINKHDLNPDTTASIEGYCREEGLEVLGRIPYDETITKAMVEGRTVVEYPGSPVKATMQDIWERAKSVLGQKRAGSTDG